MSGHQKLAKTLSLEEPLDWEKKLQRGAKELLVEISTKWESCWEAWRRTESADDIKKAGFKDLDWTPCYKDVTFERELFDLVVDKEKFIGMVEEVGEAVQEYFEHDFEEAFLVGFAFRHAILFRVNGLDHPRELLAKIKHGDEQALFDFARVDKAIIGHKYVQDRIRVAQLTGDVEFFKKLANSLRHDPRNFKVAQRGYFLEIIAKLAVEYLSIKNVCLILEEACGIFVEDVETVRKAWNRAGLNKINSQNTS